MSYNNAKLKSLLTAGYFDTYLRGVADDMTNDIELSINEVSAGQTQERSDPTRTVVASRPGDPPNTDRGFLVASIKSKKIKDNTYAIHDGVSYGIELELGTSQIKARPFIRPVFKAWKKNIAADFKKQQVIK